jgi:hypothetical protein
MAIAQRKRIPVKNHRGESFLRRTLVTGSKRA